jgi:hypothetical protein
MMWSYMLQSDGGGFSMGTCRAVFYCNKTGIMFLVKVGSMRVASCLYRLMGDRMRVLPCRIVSGMRLTSSGLGERGLLCVALWA